MRKIDELSKTTGFDKDFLEWFFSAQNEKELNSALKERERLRNYLKRYYKEHPEKAREMRRRAYEKIKSDPIKYQRFKARNKIYYKMYIIRVKSDPIKYQKYLERNRKKSRKKYEKMKQNPEWLAKHREKQRKYYHEKIKTNPEKYQNYINKSKEYNKKYYEKIKQNPIRHQKILERRRARYKEKKEQINIGTLNKDLLSKENKEGGIE